MGLNSLDLKDVPENQSPNGIPLLSFFTGLGFLDIGFMQAGFDVVWRNECHVPFAEAFEHGLASMGHSPTGLKIDNTSSIIKLGPRAIARDAFRNTERPPVFGVIGGPPCPDFSSSGNHKGESGEHGKLSKVYVDRIMALKPTFFVFENVQGLAGYPKHRCFLNKLITQLSQDYSVSCRVLDALDYGVPQERKRLFLVGFRTGWLKARFLGETSVLSGDWYPWPKDSRYVDAKTRFLWPGRAPFGGEPLRPPGIPEQLMVGTHICCPDEILELPNGIEGFQPKSARFKTVEEGDVSCQSFKRLHRWRYSPTVAYGNNEVHLHPIHPRRLTVREAMRLQSCPDKYALPAHMSLSSKFKAIGNGVPVKLAHAVAISIAQVLGNDLYKIV